ncbi:MAG: hypothetical protein RQ833_11560 [Sphingomonadaceae bacterium]|nr:hypothetical protein [Sphingomonadaceae bacterium]
MDRFAFIELSTLKVTQITDGPQSGFDESKFAQKQLGADEACQVGWLFNPTTGQFMEPDPAFAPPPTLAEQLDALKGQIASMKDSRDHLTSQVSLLSTKIDEAEATQSAIKAQIGLQG